MKKTLFGALLAFAALCACNTNKENTTLETADLTGAWNITEAKGLSTDSAETLPFIHFTDSGTINGNASVNTFFGRFTSNGDSLNLYDMGATMMMGRSMDLEMAIMQAMEQCTTIEIVDSVLYVKDAEGNRIMTLERSDALAL